MNEIIKKAIEGGWMSDYPNFDRLRISPAYYEFWDNKGVSKRVGTEGDILLDPLFWQALGKACGWGDVTKDKDWLANALEFHEINLTEGWDKAVEYLTSIISSSSK
jgi:hypothetical protein